MSYTPPSGSLTLRFKSGYTPPTGGLVLVLGGTQWLAGGGFDAQAVGTAALSPGANPQGFDAQEFGAANLSIGGRLLPSGFDPLATGTAVMGRTVKAHGSDMAGYSSTNWVSHLDRQFPPASWLSALHGTPSVDNFTRTLETLGQPSMVFGRAMMGRHVPLPLSGFDALSMGSAEVLDNHQDVLPPGLDAQLFGATVAWLKTQVAAPPGFRTFNDGVEGQWRFGLVSTQMMLRYIVQVFHEDTDTTLVFGRVTVALRTIALETGIAPPKFPNGTVLSLGPTIAPDGLDAAAFDRPDVSHGIRSLTPDGVEPPWISTRAQAWHGPTVERAGAGDMQRFGGAALEKTRRYFNRIGNWESMATGDEAYIDFGVRTLAVYRPPTSWPIPEPWVSLGTRTLEPAGIEPVRQGAPTLEIHHTIIAPRWIMRDAYGDGAVVNAKRAVKPYPFDSAEFGRPRGRSNKVFPEGFSWPEFGRSLVRDRKQTVAVGGGPAPPTIATTHRIDNAIMVPGDQTFHAPGFYSMTIGVHHQVSGNSIYPVWDEFDRPNEIFGDMVIRSMGIDLKDYGIYLSTDDQYGIPTVSWNTIYVTSADPSMFVGLPILRDNTLRPEGIYPGVNGVDVSYFAKVEQANRSFKMNGDQDTLVFGETAIELKHRVLGVYGIPKKNFGLPRMWPFKLKCEGNDAANVSELAEVANVTPNNSELPIDGMDGLGMGMAWADNFIRTLSLTGFDSMPTTFGLATRAHYPEPYLLEGWLSQAFGTAWVSYKNREFAFDGFDAYQDGPTTGKFTDQMRVKRGQPLFPVGLKSDSHGFGRVSNKTQYIGMDGNDTGIIGIGNVANKKQIIGAYPPSSLIIKFGKAAISRQ